ncbi:hypothetical protein JKP88DRAFT_272693 [Tribonema minus]|uniref:SF3 helicase domain-containing protein n=1 Tax=Tribonema minus TaxID=303371 RepID=A0A835Z699_9STRA|nr:hypothetical protein JKP88DRAFT_272693 [Tribonema minus]
MEYFDSAEADDGDEDMAMPVQDLSGQIAAMEQTWICNVTSDPISMLQRIYDWGTGGYDVESATRTYEEAAQQVTQLYAMVQLHEDVQLKPRVTRLIRSVQESYHTLIGVSGWCNIEQMPSMAADDMIIRFTSNGIEKDSDVQLVYRFILSWCNKFQFRHKCDVVYKEIIINGRRTRAWVPASKFLGTTETPRMKDLISFICTKKRNDEMHNKLINVPASKLTEKLEMCRETEFPMLKTTRAWISFKDGIYNAYNDIFLTYDDPEIQFPVDMAVCTYKPINFAPAYIRPPGGIIPKGVPLHPMCLSTPMFDAIMNDQELCGITKFWLMAMLGRCLFWSDVLDSWQVVLYIKGIAGTGKSTLVNLISQIYENDDVFVIPNNTEGTFGLQGLTPRKLLWVVPETKEDFNLDQAQFQSLVSHEKLALPRKHQGQFEGYIMAQGMMAGNLTPQRWNDNAASIQRRIFMINFSKQLGKTKTDLLQCMQAEELPAIIRKIVNCYLRAVDIVGDQDIWKCGLLSKHIMDQHTTLGESANPLKRFFKISGILDKKLHTIGATEFNWCPLSVFWDRYKNWRKESDDGKSSACNADVYTAIFADEGVSVEDARFKWGTEEFKDGKVVIGVVPHDGKSNMVVVEGEDNPFIQPRTDDTDPLKITQAMYDRRT